jgi:transposase-like protein
VDVARDRAEQDGTSGLGTGDLAEIKRLRAENAELRMERDVLKRSVVLWVLSRTRDNTHNAEHRIMPRMPPNRLRGKGSVPTHSA